MYLDDFLPRIFGICSDANTFGSYDPFSKAEIACSSETTCIGIVDKSCDNQGPYRLCKTGYSFVYPSDSCIHKKREYSGK